VLTSVSLALSQHQPKQRDHGYGASASRGMPVYSPALLVLINRLRRDGSLSWHWYTSATGDIQTHDLVVTSLAPYHSATTYHNVQLYDCITNTQENIECIVNTMLIVANKWIYFQFPPTILTINYRTMSDDCMIKTTDLVDSAKIIPGPRHLVHTWRLVISCHWYTSFFNLRNKTWSWVLWRQLQTGHVHLNWTLNLESISNTKSAIPILHAPWWSRFPIQFINAYSITRCAVFWELCYVKIS